jgi:hypothetical protein
LQKEGTLRYKYWDFIENGDFDWLDATPAEHVYFREVAAAFLRATFEPPEGYVIDVLEAQYHESRFSVIALGWNHEQEPISLNERTKFIRRMIEPLKRFVHAVDWEIVSKIRDDTKDGSGANMIIREHSNEPGIWISEQDLAAIRKALLEWGKPDP